METVIYFIVIGLFFYFMMKGCCGGGGIRTEVLARDAENTSGTKDMKGMMWQRQMKRKKGAVKISEDTMITPITKIDYTDLGKISF